MIILTIRTDKQEAEIGLFDDEKQLAYLPWQAHRQLAETIHIKIRELLKSQKYQLANVNGVVIFQGPGSFTGLRIGISVANALADGLQIPIAAVTSEKWTQQGIKRLLVGGNDSIALPQYGSEARTTKAKK